MSFVRHVMLKLRPGSLNHAINIFATEALPLLRQKLGFSGAMMFGDDAIGTGVIAIFWQRREESVQLESNGFYREQIQKFQDVLLAYPDATLLSVGLYEHGSGCSEIISEEGSV